ncbi:MAG: 4-hydroxy-3-methylbut-2-en-1-yl diphosphate synthase (flavodoxin) [Vicingaceae bacterium]|nr:MAG: 4-hydroxy-3-methylbut-2-en-1-yl diphosphate synthase (flavodoxin) [Vicingaceae bacterium]
MLTKKIKQIKSYCISINQYKRLPTIEVSIGDLKMGGAHPIRIQSMTTTDTMNTKATVEQAIRMIEAGCELVRITAPSIKEAENLKNIKEELKKRGYRTPIVADIHFTPNAAMVAARLVEKVRINPGNYADKKKFEIIEYTEKQYQEELEKIREKFLPLVKICKEYGTAMRIGTNHGSLSDRIMSRYGDTPEGMVESAMEFVRICKDENFHNIVLSMKASNPQVMIQAYRLLVVKMREEGTLYPLHLGVTEAGDGEDGRIKSAVGIGTLLEDGIGDTIRVSLTEDPENEMPVARKLAIRYPFSIDLPEMEKITFNPFAYEKRETHNIQNIIGSDLHPMVFSQIQSSLNHPGKLLALGYVYNPDSDKWNIKDNAADYVLVPDIDLNINWPENLNFLISSHKLKEFKHPRIFPVYNSITEFIQTSTIHPDLNFIVQNVDNPEDFPDDSLLQKNNIVWILTGRLDHPMKAWRNFINYLNLKGSKQPVVFQYESDIKDKESFTLYASTDLGALFTSGMGNGVWIRSKHFDNQFLLHLSFNILQACRERISKTEYIACPSCGRTLFDLQETTQKIRAATAHLKGLKIGIMGCIVNGPGEMADADYGYVGSGPGKITLYKKKEIVQRNVPEDQAVDALINLIKSNGDWKDPNQ